MIDTIIITDEVTSITVSVPEAETITISEVGAQGPAGASGTGTWGDITGTLSNQTDLKAALDGKQIAGSYAPLVHTHDDRYYTETETNTLLSGKVDTVAGKGLSTEDYSTAEKTKLAGIASGATANSSDATLLARANHTGTQATSTITGLDTTLASKQDASTAATLAGVQTLTNKTLTSPVINTPTGIVKGDVGLSNVDNTSDLNKPISTATQTALNAKAPLASPTFTGTVSGITSSMVGLGNVDNTSDATKNSAVATLTNKTIDGGSNTLSNIPQSAVTSLTTDLAGKQPDIQWQSQSVNAGSPGDASTVNVTGYGLTSAVSGSTNTITNSVFDFLRGAPLVNEFYSSSGLYGIGSNATGTGASWGATTGTADHPGIGQYTTGTTATGRVYIATGTTPILLGNCTWETGGIVRGSVLSTSAERYTYIFGFGDVVTADNQVDGVYFLYDEGGVSTGSAASGNWQCVTSSNSTRTFTTTTIPVTSAQWYKLQIRVNAAGTSVDFLIDGVVVVTHTTNIPTGAGRNTGWVGMMGKSVGTTSRTFDIDYMYLISGAFTTTR